MEKNGFVSSLGNLTADDLGKKQKNKIPVYSIVRYLLLGACLAALIYSTVYIGRSVIHYAMADDTYSEVSKIFSGSSGVEPMYAMAESLTTPDYENCQSGEVVVPVVKQIDREYEKKRNELYALKEKYPNLYGWIEIPGTNIDYPIMQADNNEYYLTHSYADAFLLGGAIFADYRCDSQVTSNYNLIVYGHHMTTNLMFHSLDKYLKESFYKKYNKIIIYTLGGKYTYEVTSVYNTNMYYNYIRTNFSSGSDFVNFATTMMKNSIYQNDTVFTEDDRMITLSTCTNRSSEGRLCIQGRLVDVYE